MLTKNLGRVQAIPLAHDSTDQSHEVVFGLDSIVARIATFKVAARFIMRGTHRGTFFGVPATGKKIAVSAMNFYRLSGGEFVEERGQPDLLGLLQQIGAVPM